MCGERLRIPGRVHDLTNAAVLARPLCEMIVEQEGHRNRRAHNQKKSSDLPDFRAAAVTLPRQSCQARPLFELFEASSMRRLQNITVDKPAIPQADHRFHEASVTSVEQDKLRGKTGRGDPSFHEVNLGS
jgi:hypothetical protein